MKIFKPDFWNKKNSFIGIFLLPVSIFLQIILNFKNKFIKEEKISIPVICVGNIYVGGTGKTPLALEIIKILEGQGKKAAIIKKSYNEHIDEFNLIDSRKAPLFKNFSRYQAIQMALKNNFDCVVLDDGYQDFSIMKNLNIVCFNEKQLTGNSMTLPSGPLREPLSSLRRCQIVIINGNVNFNFEKKIKKISNNISIYYSKYLPINIEGLKNKDLIAFAGIGNPENFFNLLEENNLNLVKKISYPDHYNYSLKELNKLIGFSTDNNLKLITTEKDFFRIKHFQLPEIESVNIKIEISEKTLFKEELFKYL